MATTDWSSTFRIATNQSISDSQGEVFFTSQGSVAPQSVVRLQFELYLIIYILFNQNNLLFREMLSDQCSPRSEFTLPTTALTERTLTLCRYLNQTEPLDSPPV